MSPASAVPPVPGGADPPASMDAGPPAAGADVLAPVEADPHVSMEADPPAFVGADPSASLASFPSGAVKAALFAHGGAFDFYQAVRLLEQMAGDEGGVGAGSRPPGRESVRFRADVGLAFPPTEVLDVRRPETGAPAEVTVSFLSLAGAHGPLPMPLAERVLSRMAESDHAGRDFLDLFHHRLVSLAWRVARRTRPVLQGVPPERTETAEALRALVGLGTPGLRDRMPGVDDRALLARAGLLAGQPRSQVGLERLLADHFGVPAWIEPLVGRWLSVAEDEWTRIGRGGAHRALGVDAALGRRAWDPQAAIRIWLGPLPLDLYRSFLPPPRGGGGPRRGGALAALTELVRFYAGVDTAFVLTLLPRGDEAPPATLPRAGAPDAARLGWTSWLRPRPRSAYPADGASSGPGAAVPGDLAPHRDPQVRIDPARPCACSG